MKKIYKSDKIRCTGEIMIEAIIVYPVIIGILFFIIAWFSIFYQHWHYNIIANEIAMRVAATYRYDGKTALFRECDVDLLTGEVSKGTIGDLQIERYWNPITLYGMKSTTVSNSKKIVDKRKETVFAGEDISVDTEIFKDSLGRRHVEVNLEAKYSVPFGGMLEYFGMEDVTKCHITTYSDCLDYINYIDSVDYVEGITDIEELDIISNVVSFVQGIYDLIN